MTGLSMDGTSIIGGGGWRSCVDCDACTHLTDEVALHEDGCPQLVDAE